MFTPISPAQTVLRIVFFGTSELACPSLAALTEKPAFEVAGVVTQPDRPKGRDLKLQPSAVKSEALRRNLAVLQPERARDPAFVQILVELKPDLIVVAAYGQILPSAILDLPRHGCLNVHASLLPKWRGAAPIQWAVLNGDAETGITIMRMDAGLDTGDILTQESTPIQSADNAQTLHDRLARIGAELLVKTIPPYVRGEVLPRKQDQARSTYARKISKEDGRLNWSEPARTLWNRTRAFTPWPGTYTQIEREGKAKLVKVWEADVTEGVGGKPGEILRADKEGIVVACGEQALRIRTLQIEGGRRVTVPEFLAGHSMKPGEVFR